MKQGYWQLAIFDWNGTLADDEFLTEILIRTIFAFFGKVPPTREERRNELGTNYMKLYEDRGITATQDELSKFRELTHHHYEKDIKPHKGAGELLQYCLNEGMRCAIVSAESPKKLIEHTVHCNLRQYFSQEYIYGGIRLHKEEVIKNLLAEEGCPPGRTFYIDDSVDGLQAAKNAGVATFGHTGGYASPERIKSINPDYIVENLEVALKIIKHTHRNS